MAPEFDPSWEYFVPDPEIESLVYKLECASIHSVLDVMTDERRSSRTSVAGFRFGSGNPNHAPSFRLGRAKRGRVYEPIPDRQCPKCRATFTPSRRAQVHCSKRCGCGTGRVLTQRLCGECRREFQPDEDRRLFCSRDCAHRATCRGNVRGIPDGFAEMYAAGAPMADMRAKFGVTTCTLKRWRRKLGLAARPTGNHSRGRRCDQ